MRLLLNDGHHFSQAPRRCCYCSRSVTVQQFTVRLLNVPKEMSLLLSPNLGKKQILSCISADVNLHICRCRWSGIPSGRTPSQEHIEERTQWQREIKTGGDREICHPKSSQLVRWPIKLTSESLSCHRFWVLIALSQSFRTWHRLTRKSRETKQYEEGSRDTKNDLNSVGFVLTRSLLIWKRL